jgi:hypothetical protein
MAQKKGPGAGDTGRQGDFSLSHANSQLNTRTATPRQESIKVELIGCELTWRRAGADWLLLHNRRRMGREVPDTQYPGMWRSIKSHGRLSDIANLPHAKSRSPVPVESAPGRGFSFSFSCRIPTAPDRPIARSARACAR